MPAEFHRDGHPPADHLPQPVRLLIGFHVQNLHGPQQIVGEGAEGIPHFVGGKPAARRAVQIKVAEQVGEAVFEPAFVEDALFGRSGEDPLHEFVDDFPESVAAFAGLAVEPEIDSGGIRHAGQPGELAKGGVTGQTPGIFDVDASLAEAQDDPRDEDFRAESAGLVSAMIQQVEALMRSQSPKSRASASMITVPPWAVTFSAVWRTMST